MCINETSLRKTKAEKWPVRGTRLPRRIVLHSKAPNLARKAVRGKTKRIRRPELPFPQLLKTITDIPWKTFLCFAIQLPLFFFFLIIIIIVAMVAILRESILFLFFCISLLKVSHSSTSFVLPAVQIPHHHHCHCK